MMKWLLRLSFVSMLVSGTMFVTQEPVEAADFCGSGYRALFTASMGSCNGSYNFCFEMDNECWADANGWDWYGICWDVVDPCEYICCSNKPY